MLGSLYQTTWHYIPEDSILQMFEIICLITFSKTIFSVTIHYNITVLLSAKDYHAYPELSLSAVYPHHNLNFPSKLFHILTLHKLNNSESKGQTFHCNSYAPVTEPDSREQF